MGASEGSLARAALARPESSKFGFFATSMPRLCPTRIESFFGFKADAPDSVLETGGRLASACCQRLTVGAVAVHAVRQVTASTAAKTVGPRRFRSSHI